MQGYEDESRKNLDHIGHLEASVQDYEAKNAEMQQELQIMTVKSEKAEKEVEKLKKKNTQQSQFSAKQIDVYKKKVDKLEE